MSKPKPPSLFKRIVALFVLLSFNTTSFASVSMRQDTGDGGQGKTTAVADFSKIVIPPDFGTLEESSFLPCPSSRVSCPVVFLIQDAHAVGDAQKSIQKITKDLSEKYGVNLFALEGASEKLDTLFFKSFPESNRLAEVLESYVQSGELSGAAAGAVLNKTSGIYSGVEDPELYEKGTGLFLEALEASKEWEKKFSEIRTKIQTTKKEIYTPQLLEMDAQIQNLASQEHMVEALQFFAHKQSALKINLANTPHLAALFEQMTSADIHAKAQLLAFTEKLRQKISNPKDLTKINQEQQAYLTEQHTQTEYAAFLKEVAQTHQVETPEEIEAFAQAADLLSQMKGKVFFEELQKFTLDLKNHFYETKAQRNLNALEDEVTVLENLVALKLSRKEWETFAQSATNEPRALWGEGEANETISELVALLHEDLKESVFTRFYQNAEMREKAIHENLLNLIKEQKTQSAALVAGGFHTQGLLETFKKENISYAVISPAIKTLEKENHYRDYMRGDVSWKSYFEVRNGRVNLYEAFARAMRDELLRSGPQSRVDSPRTKAKRFYGGLRSLDYGLAQRWRDQIIRNLAADQNTARAQDYTRFIDEVAQESKSQDQTQLKKQWLAKVENFIQGLRHLHKEKQYDTAHLYPLLGQPAHIPFEAAIPFTHRPASFGFKDRSENRTARELESEREEELKDTNHRIRDKIGMDRNEKSSRSESRDQALGAQSKNLIVERGENKMNPTAELLRGKSKFELGLLLMKIEWGIREKQIEMSVYKKHTNSGNEMLRLAAVFFVAGPVLIGSLFAIHFFLPGIRFKGHIAMGILGMYTALAFPWALRSSSERQARIKQLNQEIEDLEKLKIEIKDQLAVMPAEDFWEKPTSRSESRGRNASRIFRRLPTFLIQQRLLLRRAGSVNPAVELGAAFYIMKQKGKPWIRRSESRKENNSKEIKAVKALIEQMGDKNAAKADGAAVALAIRMEENRSMVHPLVEEALKSHNPLLRKNADWVLKKTAASKIRSEVRENENSPKGFAQKGIISPSKNEASEENSLEIQAKINRAFQLKEAARARAVWVYRANREIFSLHETHRQLRKQDPPNAANLTLAQIRQYSRDFKILSQRIVPDSDSLHPDQETKEYQDLERLSYEEWAQVLKVKYLEIKNKISELEIAYHAKDSAKLEQLNREVIALHKMRIKAQLLRILHQLSAPELNESALMFQMTGLYESYMRLAGEYSWRYRRAVVQAGMKRIQLVGRFDQETKTYDYSGFRILISPAEKDKEESEVIIRRNYWQRVDLGANAYTYQLMPQEIKVSSLDKALRMEIKTLLSQEKDYEQILLHLSSLSYAIEILEDYGKNMTDYQQDRVRNHLLEILEGPGGLTRGLVEQKAQGAANISAALTELEKENFPGAQGFLKSTLELLQNRLQDITGKNRGIARQTDYIVHEIRRQETFRVVQALEGTAEVPGLLMSAKYEEAAALLNLLNQTYYRSIASPANQYSSLQLYATYALRKTQELSKLRKAQAAEETNLLRSVLQDLARLRFMTQPKRSEVRQDLAKREAVAFSRPVMGIAVSSKGEKAFVVQEGKIFVGKIKENEKPKDFEWEEFQAHQSPISQMLLFTQNGKEYLASESQNRSIRIWDAETMKRILDVPGESLQESHPLTSSLAVSPNGRYLAASEMDLVKIYDLSNFKSKKPFLKISANDQDIKHPLVFLPDSRRLAVTIANHLVLYDISQENAPAKALREFNYNGSKNSRAVALSLSQDNKIALALNYPGKDSQVLVWDLKEEKPTAQSLSIQGLQLRAVLFLNSKTLVAAAGKTLQIFSLNQNNQWEKIADPIFYSAPGFENSLVESLARMSLESEQLIWGTSAGQVETLDLTPLINSTTQDSSSRSEMRNKEDLLIGVHDRDPEGHFYPDWWVMRVLGQAVFDKQAQRPGAVKLKDILTSVQEKLKGAYFSGPRYSEDFLQSLLNNLVNQYNLLKYQDEGYAIAVDSKIFAIQMSHSEYFRKEFERHLAALRGKKEKGAGLEMESFVQQLARKSERWLLYPVESAWPILRAMDLLSTEEKKELTAFLSAPKHSQLRNYPLVDTMLYVLTEEIASDWVSKYAPTIENSTLYYISPETWLAAGGLGRVGQYHTMAAKKLIGNKASLVTIEPYYSTRIKLEKNFQGEWVETLVDDIDYSKLAAPIHNIHLVKTLKVRVTKKGKREWVNVEVFKGKNDQDMETYFFKDVPTEGKYSYFTKILYGYGVHGNATREEFTEFASKVSLKIVQELEAERRKQQGLVYQPALIWSNDGQTALVPVFKRISDDLEKMSAPERERIKNDSSHPYHELMDLIQENGSSLGDAETLQTTHTYRNRIIAGASLFEDLRLPESYRPYFRSGEHVYLDNKNGNYRDAYDATSAGVRLADIANGVAAIHAQEVGKLDQGIRLVGITNGDDRKATRQVWDSIFKSQEFQTTFPQADSENPSPEQMVEGKKIAKIKLSENSSLLKINPLFAQLNSEKIIISYSGRMVDEKTGRSRAFTDDNLRALVRMGAQIILMGNVQPNKSSREIYEKLKQLEEELKKERETAIAKGENFGILIVATGWNIPEQRYLLAATDIQVNDSDRDPGRGTEAAGLTETDAPATGGLEFSPPFLEAIFQQQGEIVDWNHPGSGNTIIPEGDTSIEYRTALQNAIARYQKNRLDFAKYQITSIQYSKILAAVPTAGHYLRLLHQTRERKKNPVGFLEDVLLGQSDGLFFINEWQRISLQEALVRGENQAVELSSNHPKVKAHVVNFKNELSAKARLVIVGDKRMIRDDGNMMKREEMINATITNLHLWTARLGLAAQDKVQVVDSITGIKYGAYTVQELSDRGLYVQLPRDTLVQTLELVPAIETVASEVTPTTLFNSENISPEIQNSLLELIPEQSFQELAAKGKRKENLIWWTPGDGFVPLEKAPKSWEETGFYFLVNKGDGQLTLTLTSTLAGAFDQDRRRSMVFENSGYAHISLEVDGERLWIDFGKINMTNPNGEFHYAFREWFSKNLKPWAQKLGFKEIQIEQKALSDEVLQKVGFVKDRENMDPHRKVWSYPLLSQQTEEDLRALLPLAAGTSFLPDKNAQILSELKFSKEDAKRFLSTEWPGFEFRKNAQEPWKVNGKIPHGISGLLEQFRIIATWGRQGEWGKIADESLRYHASRGDIFQYLNSILINFKSNSLAPMTKEIEKLAHEANAALEKSFKEKNSKLKEGLWNEVIRKNYAAIYLLDQYHAWLAAQIFESYMLEISPAELDFYHQHLFSNRPLRRYVASYLNQHPQAGIFKVDTDGMDAFKFNANGKKYLIGINVDSIPIPNPLEGTSKARGRIIPDENFQAFLRENGISENQMFGSRNSRTGITYGTYSQGEKFRLGLPEPEGIEVLELFKTEIPLIALPQIKNDIKELRENIRKAIQAPGELERSLLELSSLPKDRARDLFEKKLPVDMALIAGLVPSVLENMYLWDPENYQELGRIIRENEKMFLEGKITSENPERQSTIVFSRSLNGGDYGQNVIGAFQFEDDPINYENGKVWSGIRKLSLRLDRQAKYQVRNLRTGELYEKEHTGAELLENWHIGIPVQNLHPEKKSQHRLGYDFYRIERANQSENKLEITASRSENRFFEQFFDAKPPLFFYDSNAALIEKLRPTPLAVMPTAVGGLSFAPGLKSQNKAARAVPRGSIPSEKTEFDLEKAAEFFISNQPQEGLDYLNALPSLEKEKSNAGTLKLKDFLLVWGYQLSENKVKSLEALQRTLPRNGRKRGEEFILSQNKNRFLTLLEIIPSKMRDELASQYMHYFTSQKSLSDLQMKETLTLAYYLSPSFSNQALKDYGESLLKMDPKDLDLLKIDKILSLLLTLNRANSLLVYRVAQRLLNNGAKNDGKIKKIREKAESALTVADLLKLAEFHLPKSEYLEALRFVAKAQQKIPSRDDAFPLGVFRDRIERARKALEGIQTPYLKKDFLGFEIAVGIFKKDINPEDLKIQKMLKDFSSFKEAMGLLRQSQFAKAKLVLESVSEAEPESLIKKLHMEILKIEKELQKIQAWVDSDQYKKAEQSLEAIVKDSSKKFGEQLNANQGEFWVLGEAIKEIGAEAAKIKYEIGVKPIARGTRTQALLEIMESAKKLEAYPEDNEEIPSLILRRAVNLFNHQNIHYYRSAFDVARLVYELKGIHVSEKAFAKAEEVMNQAAAHIWLPGLESNLWLTHAMVEYEENREEREGEKNPVASFDFKAGEFEIKDEKIIFRNLKFKNADQKPTGAAPEGFLRGDAFKITPRAVTGKNGNALVHAKEVTPKALAGYFKVIRFISEGGSGESQVEFELPKTLEPLKNQKEQLEQVLKNGGSLKRSQSPVWRIQKDALKRIVDLIRKNISATLEVEEAPHAIVTTENPFLDLIMGFKPHRTGEGSSHRGREELIRKWIHDIEIAITNANFDQKKFEFDPSQKEALVAMLSDRYPVVFIQGPPGTGKTNTTAAALAILKNILNKKTVVMSQQNHAADNILLRLLDLLEKSKTSDEFIVRLGNNEAGITDQSIHDRLWLERQKKLAAIYANSTKGAVLAGSSNGMFLDWKMRNFPILEKERTVTLIMDESGRANVPESITPFEFLGKGLGKVILIGDHFQLGPTGLTEETLREATLELVGWATSKKPPTPEELISRKKKTRLAIEGFGTKSLEEIFGDDSIYNIRKSLFEISLDLLLGSDEKGEVFSQTLPFFAFDQNRRSTQRIVHGFQDFYVQRGLNLQAMNLEEGIFYTEDTAGQSPEYHGNGNDNNGPWEEGRFISNYGEVDKVIYWLNNLINDKGLDPSKANDIAVITPYRGQEKAIRQAVTSFAHVHRWLSQLNQGAKHLEYPANALNSNPVQRRIQAYAAEKLGKQASAQSIASETKKINIEIRKLKNGGFSPAEIENAFKALGLGEKFVTEENLESKTFAIVTIDTAIGNEWKGVITSWVRSNKEGKVGFIEDFRRRNVAGSRAAQFYVQIGDFSGTFAHSKDEDVKAWARKQTKLSEEDGKRESASPFYAAATPLIPTSFTPHRSELREVVMPVVNALATGEQIENSIAKNFTSTLSRDLEGVIAEIKAVTDSQFATYASAVTSETYSENFISGHATYQQTFNDAIQQHVDQVRQNVEANPRAKQHYELVISMTDPNARENILTYLKSISAVARNHRNVKTDILLLTENAQRENPEWKSFFQQVDRLGIAKRLEFDSQVEKARETLTQFLEQHPRAMVYGISRENVSLRKELASRVVDLVSEIDFNAALPIMMEVTNGLAKSLIVKAEEIKEETMKLIPSHVMIWGADGPMITTEALSFIYQNYQAFAASA